MENKINVSVPAEYNGTPITIVLREGVAETNIERTPFNIKADIAAPLEYINNQKPHGEGTVVMFDGEKKTITAYLNHGTSIVSTVTGTMEYSQQVKDFGINQDKRFTLEALRKLIRVNRPWFADAEAYNQFVLQISAFSASIQANINDSKDTRGNVDNAFKRKVNTDVPLDFKLNIPIFKGSKSNTFVVDVCIDVSDAGASFWLESAEMMQLEHAKISEVFEIHRKTISDMGYTCLVIS